MFNNYLSLKENSIVFTINLDNLAKENNYFQQTINSKYSESIDKIEIIDFQDFFYNNYKDLKNFDRNDNNIISIMNAVEDRKRKKIIYNSSDCYNPFPKKIEVGHILDLIVIKDIKTNYIAITDKSNIIKTTF